MSFSDSRDAFPLWKDRPATKGKRPAKHSPYQHSSLFIRMSCTRVTGLMNPPAHLTSQAHRSLWKEVIQSRDNSNLVQRALPG